ncbi:hypothetical protein TELCIR_16456, partial [Teladorsagia circumcincta]
TAASHGCYQCGGVGGGQGDDDVDLTAAAVMIFDINRFHFFVLLTWQFAIFFASQQIFPIFSNYVPEWQCDDGPVSKNCTVYTTCNGTLRYPNSQFHSAALE